MITILIKRNNPDDIAEICNVIRNGFATDDILQKILMGDDEGK